MKIHPNGTIEIESGFQGMINIEDGSLVEVRIPEVEFYKTQKGWLAVSNPKRTYYPEYDVKSGAKPKKSNTETESIEGLVGEDV